MPTQVRQAVVWLVVGLTVLGCASPSRSVDQPSAQSPAQSSEATSAPRTPKRLVAAIQGDPFTVYQKLNLSGSVRGISEIERMVNAGLGNTDTTGVLRPLLAEALPTIDNGQWKLLPDGRMETTWKIRPGITWHDGTPFTADDLVFTTQMVRDPELPAFRDPAYSRMDTVEALDPQTVVVRWKSPYIRADEMFSDKLAMPVAKHILEPAYSQDKSNFTSLPYWSTEWVGVGPYKLKDWERGVRVTVQANDSFTLGRPKIDEIEIQTIPDNNTIVASLLAGKLDVVLGRALSLDQAVQLRDRWTEGNVMFPLTSLMSTDPQMYNPTPAVVSQIAFRKAIYESIDRKELADSIDYGITPLADSILEPGTPEYKATESAIVKYPFDPRQAAQLIEGLGYTKGGDGMYRDANGPLRLEIRASQGDINPKTMAAVADSLQRVGVGIDQVVIPLQRVNDEEYRSNFPAFIVNGQPISAGLLERFHSTQARLAENRYTGSNRARYMNPEMDSLIDRYQTTIPLDARMELARQITRHIGENLPILPLFYDSWPGVQVNRLTNATAAAAASNATWNVYEWDLR